MRWLLPILLALGCQSDDKDPCAAMCAAATRLYGACLADWGLDWTATGRDNGADFFHDCETWAWELRQIEADPRSDGAPGDVDRACRQREAIFDAPDASCEDFDDGSWDNPPWAE